MTQQASPDQSPAGTGRPAVLVLNGPNLDLLGRREPDTYGTTTLAELHEACRHHGESLGLRVDCRQSNAEGTLVEHIHEAMDAFDAVVVNAAAYSHTSIAIHDALGALSVPVVEVHLTNIHRREPFRHHSYVSAVASAVIVGAGTHGYLLALDHVRHLLSSR